MAREHEEYNSKRSLLKLDFVGRNKRKSEYYVLKFTVLCLYKQVCVFAISGFNGSEYEDVCLLECWAV
jgi:hypothetical protein